jgi:hypothetical protein
MAAVPQERDEKKNLAAIPLRMTRLSFFVWSRRGRGIRRKKPSSHRLFSPDMNAVFSSVLASLPLSFVLITSMT